MGVTMLTKSQASKLAQQRAQEAEAEFIKAEQQVEDEEGADEMIGAGRHEVELSQHQQHQQQAASGRSLGASRQSFSELSLAGSPRDSLALQSEGGASPREHEHE